MSITTFSSITFQKIWILEYNINSPNQTPSNFLNCQCLKDFIKYVTVSLGLNFLCGCKPSYHVKILLLLFVFKSFTQQFLYDIRTKSSLGSLRNFVFFFHQTNISSVPTKKKKKNSRCLRMCLDTVYFAETEKLLLKVL